MRPFAILISAFLVACSLQPADAILFSGSGGGVTPTPPIGTLTAMQVVNPSASSTTNMPFCVGVPFSTTAISSSQHLEVTDGGVAILADEVNRATDMSSAIRSESLCGVIPSATGSQVKNLVLTVASGAPATGTDITIADISAWLTANSLSVPVDFTKLNGVAGTWSADLQTAINTGNTAWVNKSTGAVLAQKYRSGGGLVTEYLIYSPAIKSGTADGQVYAMHVLRCFKAARTAVNTVTNPILGCKDDVEIGNSWLQAATPVNNWYGLSVGVGGSAANLANTTPTQTLSGFSGTGVVTITASAPLFTLNDSGRAIADGTGFAVINNYTDSTHVTVTIYTAFAGSSLTSGNYTIYGTAHPYGATNHYTALLGSAQMPLVERGQVYLGNAWNSGASTGGPGSYVMSTSMMMNNALSTTTGMVTGTNSGTAAAIAAAVTNPNARQFNGAYFIGPLTGYLETSGGRGDIGVDPDWNVTALIRYDSDAATNIFKSADFWATFPKQHRDQNTGLNGTPCNAGPIPTCSGSVNYVYDDGRFTGTIVAGAAQITPWDTDLFAHDPAGYYLPALLSGDYFYILGQQLSAQYAPGVNNQGETGIRRTDYNAYNYCCGLQTRASAWATLAISNSTILTPDNSVPLGITKSVAKAWQANLWGGVPNSTKELFLDLTGAPGDVTKRYSTDGFHFLGEYIASYMHGYNSIAIGAMYERGALDTNGRNFRDWLMANQVDPFAKTTEINPAYMSRNYFAQLYNTALNGVTYATAAIAKEWPLFYRALATSPNGGLIPNQTRAAAGTMTLSATSGAAVTATFSTGNYFGAGSAFYTGGWVQTSDGGAARIVSVTDANHIVIDTTATAQYWYGGPVTGSGNTFGSTSYVYNNQPGILDPNIVIPGAAPGDPYGPEFVPYVTAPGDDYFLISQAVTVLGKDQGVTGGSAACTTAFAMNSGAYSPWFKPGWYLSPRSSAC